MAEPSLDQPKLLVQSLSRTCRKNAEHMDSEQRNVKISVMLPPGVAAKLDTYAQRHRWSRSNAVALMVEWQLAEAEEEEGPL